jgi:hypothetical protein
MGWPWRQDPLRLVFMHIKSPQVGVRHGFRNATPLPYSRETEAQTEAAHTRTQEEQSFLLLF